MKGMGRSVFSAMMTDRHQARYFAFDLLWLDGEDLKARPLLERKERLKRILPARSADVLYVDHVVRTGTGEMEWSDAYDRTNERSFA
jgi:ATP-dependent DNA ligase